MSVPVKSGARRPAKQTLKAELVLLAHQKAMEWYYHGS
jgi:hypothetical protein